ncbi:prolipoprotein diacylglyceryl transferase family protein [Desmospora profundinema]|uniref:Prolipoprotein diacylglyceryltransferase n=1 Tax=Desmospora profundinema TaxID=1571184 RepID=A0ABU1IHL3_9BACL|nr:prolipoprotein diacylglyceryl transferase family protein [Desmospora profundinema]MDR6224032.1 prolipoprotein diacylglyceryltransferase [Desmospora profundinema]
MKVVLFYIGDFPVRSYGLIIAMAVLLAVGVAFYLAKGTKYREYVVDMSFYVVIGAILGARLWEVLSLRSLVSLCAFCNETKSAIPTRDPATD